MRPPSRPVGQPDTISRILAPKLTAALGTQVVVENKPSTDALSARTSPPRRHPKPTLPRDLALLAAGFLPENYPKLPYNVVTDFSHVTLIGHTPKRADPAGQFAPQRR